MMKNHTLARTLLACTAMAACVPLAHAQRNLASNGSGTLIAGDNNASVVVNGQQIITATDGNARVETTVGGGANRVERGELVIYSWDREAEPAGLF